MPADQVEPIIEIRMKRQELLKRPDAPLMFFVMDEAVVRRLVGGKEVMRQQLQRMIDVADHGERDGRGRPLHRRPAARHADAVRDP